jgi:hypothetical protein
MTSPARLPRRLETCACAIRRTQWVCASTRNRASVEDVVVLLVGLPPRLTASRAGDVGSHTGSAEIETMADVVRNDGEGCVR